MAALLAGSRIAPVGCGEGRSGFRQVSRIPAGREPMHYKAKSVAALQIVIGGFPDRTKVHCDPNLGVSAKTVGDLRRMTTWPDNLSITTPPDHSPDDIIRVSKATHSSRYAPKP
jgi:hypothetical protein